MFPVLESLVAVLIGLHGYGSIGDAQVDPWTIAGGFILAVLLARWAVTATARLAAVDRRRAAAFRRGAFARIRIAFLGVYAYQIYVGRWPGIVGELGVGHWILVDEFLVLAPYGALLLLAWISSARADRHVSTRSGWTTAQYVAFQARNVLLPLGPIFVLFGMRDVLKLLAGSSPLVGAFMDMYETVPAVNEGVTIAVLGVLFILMPFIFRWAWRMKPLEPGPLRTRLDAFSKRVGFRAREILVWPTQRQIPNAAIIGLFPAVSYVMLTDGLIDALDEDELEAVFAHEVGHATHRHLLQLLVLSVTFILVAPSLMSLLPLELLMTGWFSMIATLGLMLAYWGGLFGWISWKFERQADVFGATATAKQDDDADGSSFISALERLADITGTPRDKAGWRHPSIASRTAYLRRFLTDPRLRGAQRRVRRGLQVALAVVFIGVVAWRATAVPDEWAAGHVYIAMKEGRWEEALDRCATIRSEETRRATTYRLLDHVSRQPDTSIPAWIVRAEAAIAREAEPRELVIPLAALLLRSPVDRRSVEDQAASIGALLRPVLDDESAIEDLRAEAAMLLGRTQLLLADYAEGPAGGRGTRTLRLQAARALLERAESLEAGPGPDSDQVLLRADLEARTGNANEAVRLYRDAWHDKASPATVRATFGRRASEAPVVAWIVRAVTGLRRDDTTIAEAEATVAAQRALAAEFDADVDDPTLVVQRAEIRLAAAAWAESSGRTEIAARLRSETFAEASRHLEGPDARDDILTAAAFSAPDPLRALEIALRLSDGLRATKLRQGLADRILAGIGDDAERARAVEDALREAGGAGGASLILLRMELAALGRAVGLDEPELDPLDPNAFGPAQARLDDLLARFDSDPSRSPPDERRFRETYAALLDDAVRRLKSPSAIPDGDELRRFSERREAYAAEADEQRREAAELAGP